MLLKIWNWISNLGVSPDHQEENELVQLYNRMSLLSGLGTISMISAAWMMDFSGTYIFVTFFVASLYFIVIALNWWGKIFAARFCISFGSPLWLSTTYFMLGGYFAQGLGILASMAITYVAYKKKPKARMLLLIFHVLIFFVASASVNTYGPVLGVIDFPYDEITVFIGGLGWATIVLYKFDRDRTALLKTLKTNNLELKNTTEELERFTYIASHDLKSPLRTIISFIGLIERDIEREQYTKIEKNLSFVKTGAEQMHFMVQDILELSTLKNHKVSDRIPVDLNLVLEKAIQNLNEDIKEKNALLHYDPLPHFVGNELEFLLLFQNFIQNGIKYNQSAQPTIHIAASELDKNLRITFSDNGIGIDEKYHQQIFQFFKRLHNANQYSGTGLGLGLCKKIINNYQGQIEIESFIGQGTTFTIILPITEVVNTPSPQAWSPANTIA